MKKILYFMGAALVMLASASCEKKETVKNDSQSSVEKVDMIFTATSKGALKTTVQSDGATVVWSESDVIKVYTANDTEGSDCGISEGWGTSSAKFSGQCASQGPWSAICPASIANGFSDGTITFTVPDVQTYKEGTFAAGAMPCVAYSNNTDFYFNHSFGVLKLNLKSVSYILEDYVQSIVIEDNEYAVLSGEFTVNPSLSAVATKSGYYGSYNIELDCGDGVAITSDNVTEFWIVVPAGVFGNGFKVTILSVNGGSAELQTWSDNTIVAGDVKSMPEKEIEFYYGDGRPQCQKDVDPYDAYDKWVYINGKMWLNENMRCTEYDTESNLFESYTVWQSIDPTEGVEKPEYMSDEQWGKLGLLYTWNEAVGVNNTHEHDYIQGICPNGSHVANKWDWASLKEEAGGETNAGRALKSSSGWSNGGNGEDSYYFEGLPAGSDNNDLGSTAYWWASTSTGSKAYYESASSSNSNLSENTAQKTKHYSVRCVMNYY